MEYHGEVSLVLYEILKDYFKFCKSLPDDDIARTMKLLGNSSLSNEKIIAIKLCNKLPSKISLEIKNTSIESPTVIA